MPQGIHIDNVCDAFLGLTFEPLPHQIFSARYFLLSPHKGLLLYHKLGSGKTCTAILIADAMLKRDMVRHIFVISPGSLRSGWIEEYCGKCGMDSHFLRKKFTFVTYNFDTSKELYKHNFDNSLVIVDEVHNFINGVKNESKSYTTIYEKIIASNCKVLALSGTPVTDNIYQLGLLGNMLKKNVFGEIVKMGRQETLSEENLDLSIVKKEYLKGIVSYFPGDPKFYPTVYYHEPIRVKMTPSQMSNYMEAVHTEEKSFRPDIRMRMTNPIEYGKNLAQYMKAIQHIFTRSASNFCYNGENTVFDDKTKTNIVLPDKFRKDGGWISMDTFRENKMFEKFSPKFAALFLNIVKNFYTKHMIYTFFIHKSGIELLETLLNRCGITTIVFSGELTDKRRIELLKKFNSPENRNGDVIRVILVSEAGNSGITLLDTNNIHILESSNDETKTQQAIGRVARFKSHINMPPDRQYVNVWRYWSIPVAGDKSDDGKEIEGIDEILYRKGIKKSKIVLEMTKLLIENSIENTNQ